MQYTMVSRKGIKGKFTFSLVTFYLHESLRHEVKNGIICLSKELHPGVDTYQIDIEQYDIIEVIREVQKDGVPYRLIEKSIYPKNGECTYKFTIVTDNDVVMYSSWLAPNSKNTDQINFYVKDGAKGKEYKEFFPTGSEVVFLNKEQLKMLGMFGC